MITSKLLFLLFPLMTVANMVETVVGFGSTLVTVAVALNFYSLDEIQSLIIPINLFLSFSILIIDRKSVDYKILFLTIFPILLPAFIIGLLSKQLLALALLKKILGFFILVIVAYSFWHFKQKKGSESIEKMKARSLLFLGGLAHGLFATGGPYVVLAFQFLSLPKNTVRGTLAFLWTFLGIIVLGELNYRGLILPQNIPTILALSPTIFLGIFIGQKIFSLLDELHFKKITLIILAIAGMNLLLF